MQCDSPFKKFPWSMCLDCEAARDEVGACWNVSDDAGDCEAELVAINSGGPRYPLDPPKIPAILRTSPVVVHVQ